MIIYNRHKIGNSILTGKKNKQMANNKKYPVLITNSECNNLFVQRQRTDGLIERRQRLSGTSWNASNIDEMQTFYHSHSYISI